VTTATDSFVIEQFIVNALAVALPAIPAHSHAIPQGTAFPAIVFNQQAGRDVSAVPAFRIALNALYQVKVIGNAGHFEDALAAAIDGALQATSGETASGIVFSLVREESISYTTLEENVVYWHRGGVYRALARAG
jgi:hypothetical protein